MHCGHSRRIANRGTERLLSLRDRLKLGLALLLLAVVGQDAHRCVVAGAANDGAGGVGAGGAGVEALEESEPRGRGQKQNK